MATHVTSSGLTGGSPRNTRHDGAEPARARRSRELLQGVGPRRLDQPVARHRAIDIRRYDGLRDQVRDAFDDFRRADLGARRDGARRSQRESVGEDRKAPEYRPLGPGEELVAPFEGRAQRLVPRHRRLSPAGEQLKTIVEVHGEATQAQGVDPRCRKLDGERQSIQPATDVSDERSVVIGELELARERRFALDEQLHGREA